MTNLMGGHQTRTSSGMLGTFLENNQQSRLKPGILLSAPLPLSLLRGAFIVSCKIKAISLKHLSTTCCLFEATRLFWKVSVMVLVGGTWACRYAETRGYRALNENTISHTRTMSRGRVGHYGQARHSSR